MSDELDRAQEETDLFIKSAIVGSRKEEMGLIHIGICHNCETKVSTPLIFCDVECRDDYMWFNAKRN